MLHSFGAQYFQLVPEILSPSFVSASKLCEPVAAAVFCFFCSGEVPALLQIAGVCGDNRGRSPLFSGGKKENDVLKGK